MLNKSIIGLMKVSAARLSACPTLPPPLADGRRAVRHVGRVVCDASVFKI